jgi:hypothetical protein
MADINPMDTAPFTAMADSGFIFIASWVVFGGYLIVALLSALCVRAAVQAADPGIGVQTWALMVVFLLAMGLNKQLDLHSGVLAWAKQVAKSQNWFEQRFLVHLIFVASVGVIGLIVLVGLRRVLVDAWRHHRPAIFGTVTLLVAIAIRLMTLPAFEKWFGWRLSWNHNWLIELIGIALIAWAAIRCLGNDDAVIADESADAIGFPEPLE